MLTCIQILIYPNLNFYLNFPDLLNTFNLTQHIKVPTHKDNNTLDLIITQEDELTATNFSVHDPVISDHLALHCILHVDKPPNIKKRINYQKLRSINTDDFLHDIVNSALYSSPKTVLAELSDQYDSVLSSIHPFLISMPLCRLRRLFNILRLPGKVKKSQPKRLNDANLNGAGILVS